MRVFILLMSFFVLNAKAHVEAERLDFECKAAAMSYGDGKGHDHIPQDCYQHSKEMALEKAKFMDQEADVEIFSYKQIVFVTEKKDDKKLTHMIAGLQTKLQSVQALTVDLEKKEIILLDIDGEIRTYSSQMTGNIVASKIFKNEWTKKEAPHLSLSLKDDKIIIDHTQSGERYELGRDSNLRVPASRRAIEWRKIEAQESE